MTMTDNLCPICQRPNDPSAKRCWYCQAVLSDDESPSKGGTDWLNSLRGDSNMSPEPNEPEPASEEPENPQESVPDWLARIRTREQEEHDAQQKGQSEPRPAEKTDLPDWLKEIKAGNSGKRVEPFKTDEPQEEPFKSEPIHLYTGVTPTVPSSKEEDDNDEWLSKLAAWKPSETPAEPPQESIPNEQAPEPAPPFADENPIPSIEIHPLSTPEISQPQISGLDASKGWQRLVPEEPEPVWQKEPEPSTLMPEEVQPPEDQTPAKAAQPDLDFEALRQELPEESITITPEPEQPPDEVPVSEVESEGASLDRLFSPDEETPVEKPAEESRPAFVEDQSELVSFVADDLPDWLATASLEKKPKKPEEPVSEELSASALEDNLEKASLPAWLQAMRPSAPGNTPPTPDEKAVSQDDLGLLAGIEGTLSGSQIGGDFRKPVSYGSALKVSERQKNNANLLANLVEESVFEQEIEEPGLKKHKKVIWRLLLAAALIAIILLSGSVFGRYTVQPALFPPEVVAVYDMVNALPADKPVLLTGDFEAAVTGELSWSSQTLLEHLLRRNLNLVILSTNPTGTTILSGQINTASQKVAGYDLSTQLVNLGYLPGGATGLQLMSGDLRSALPFTHDLQAAWNSAVLSPVNSLSDFGAVIVLSDKAENARVWIEQIQPVLGSTPLAFVVSAQAAPLLQPYYLSGQIEGYVAGFNGSLAYEKIFAQPSSASEHFSAFQFSVLFVSAVLLLAGLINLIRPAASERKG